MVAVAHHIRCTAEFSLGPTLTPRETASCTVNFRIGDAITTGGWLQDLADDCFTDWATWVGSSGGHVNGDVHLERTKVSVIMDDGHFDGDVYVGTDGTRPNGAGGTQRHPWQDTLAVTLVHGTHGRGRFGRIYLPPQTYAMDANGLVDATDHAAMWAAVQTLMTNLSNAPGSDAGFGLVIAGGNPPAMTIKDVDSIRYGRVVDTQRRRRRSLAETYAAVSFTP